jgi:hypothetical protein
MLELALQRTRVRHGNSAKDNLKKETGQLKLRSLPIDAAGHITQSYTFTGQLHPCHNKQLGGKIISPRHFGTMVSKNPKSSAQVISSIVQRYDRVDDGCRHSPSRSGITSGDLAIPALNGRPGDVELHLPGADPEDGHSKIIVGLLCPAHKDSGAAI